MGLPGPRKVANRLLGSREVRGVGLVATTTYATKGRASGWNDRWQRCGVRLRKTGPDALQLLHQVFHRVVPSSLQRLARTALYGRKDRKLRRGEG
jgi:hypothetical protein